MNESIEPKSQRWPRLRFPAICAMLFWTITIVLSQIDKLYFIGFMVGGGSAILFGLLFIGWWWLNKGLTLAEKFLGFLLIIGGGVLAFKFGRPPVNIFVMLALAFPLVATGILIWLRYARNKPRPVARLGFVAVVLGIWGIFLVIRADAPDGSMRTAFHWRWTPTPEEKFLAERRVLKPNTTAVALEAAATDWTEFRGPNRDGVFYKTSITTNWTPTPPLIWKRTVGPAWSAMTVIGNRLFTQEQRGPKEVVVCYDSKTGDELWANEEEDRFEEVASGIGPRATPTFLKGRLYTFGATGLLKCLDAATGKPIWQRDTKKDTGANPPMWGYAASPLIVDDKVIIHTGGGSNKGLLAYKSDTGDLVWTTEAGDSSYSSPELATLDGVQQILMLHDSGVSGIDLNGKELWRTGPTQKGVPRSTQPRVLSNNRVLVGEVNGPNTTLLTVSKSDANWSITTNWISKDLKPEFPDFVVHKDYAYGFDLGIFTCINLADGKRAWKDGRYGRGQVVLLTDQNLLLVASEKGELVLLAADPTAHRELGRFKAINGKTWNSPIIRGQEVFIRNAEEMACYDLSGAPPKITSR